MSATGPLAPGLLAGWRIVASSITTDLAERLAALGAELFDATDAVGGDPPPASPIHGLVHDARPAFGAGGDAAILEATLAAAWSAVRAVAAATMLEPGSPPGAIVLIAPAPDAGPFAAAAAAGLENLARSLSVEWARHAVTTTAFVPAPGDAEAAALAELVAWCLSPAGGYVSGGRITLSPAPATR